MMHRWARQSGCELWLGLFCVLGSDTIVTVLLSSQMYLWIKGTSLIGLMGHLARTDLNLTKSKLKSKGFEKIAN